MKMPAADEPSDIVGRPPLVKEFKFNVRFMTVVETFDIIAQQQTIHRKPQDKPASVLTGPNDSELSFVPMSNDFFGSC
jgi:hypothetical protein